MEEMTDEQIVARVAKYHCLAEPAVEIPAIIDAFLFSGGDRFLEIGTWQGATVSALALATPRADIWTVDLPEPHKAKWNPQPRALTGLAYRELGLSDRIKQLWMDSGELVAFVGKEAFDMVFVDADHSTDGCLRDLRTASQLLRGHQNSPSGTRVRDGGIIVVHDYTDESDAKRPHWTIWVHEAVRQFCAESGFVVERLPGWLAALHQPGAQHRVGDPVGDNRPPAGVCPDCLRDLSDEELEAAEEAVLHARGGGRVPGDWRNCPHCGCPVERKTGAGPPERPSAVIAPVVLDSPSVVAPCGHSAQSWSKGSDGMYCADCKSAIVRDEDNGRWYRVDT